MADAVPTADADLAAKVKLKALAWLANHHNVTLGQAFGYLMVAHQKHWPVIIEAWRDHGLSAELVATIVERFGPSPQPGAAP